MIIFVNGPFGIGKTTTAYLLVERLPKAMVYDPEVIGSCVQHLLNGMEHADDYQDYVLWRSLTVEVARLLRETYGGSLILPMSVTQHAYYETLMQGFRQDRSRPCLFSPYGLVGGVPNADHGER